MPAIVISFFSEALSTYRASLKSSQQFLYLFGGVIPIWQCACDLQAVSLMVGSLWKYSEHLWKMNLPILSKAVLIGHCGKSFIIAALKMSINMGAQK